MTPMFNTDAALPHNHDLSESLILLVLDTLINESTRCTTENNLYNCFTTDSPTPSRTSYGFVTTIVEHLKTSHFRCSNSPQCSLIHIVPPWVVSGMFNDCTSRSVTLRCVGAKHTPKDRMTLVSSSKNTRALVSSSKTRTISTAYSRPTRFLSEASWTPGV
ncbi:hypothetical protein CSKR_103587 [Clonorchis sinensis]|uniref:Uncharacterized protein n=1 Tax=Clonorchis sinensis TaxID=79923 RepID=A0A419PTW9_CLOSI|nr:hypothetical protein CSKR_103587 [Clonorchis sinensis]